MEAPAEAEYGSVSEWRRGPAQLVTVLQVLPIHPPTLVCNRDVVVSYHHMKRREPDLRPKAVTFIWQHKPSASPFTPALTLNGCQER